MSHLLITGFVCKCFILNSTNLPLIHFGINSHHNLVISICFSCKLYPEVLNLIKQEKQGLYIIYHPETKLCSPTIFVIALSLWSSWGYKLKHGNTLKKILNIVTCALRASLSFLMSSIIRSDCCRTVCNIITGT